MSDSLLVHYDAKKDLVRACDASPYSIEALLSHVMENGDERPGVVASQTLTSTKKKYVQIEKEALGIIYGVKCLW